MRNLFLALFIMLLPASSFHCLGQTKAKEKLAVYVTGDVDPVYKKFIGSKLVSGITRSDGYTAVERTTDFLSELEREQNYQMSGVVNDSQIAKLGEQFGVRYVLISDINYLFDSMFISARLIDVQTAQIVNSYEVCQEVNDPESLSSISDALVSEMFGVQLSSSQISSGDKDTLIINKTVIRHRRIYYR